MKCMLSKPVVPTTLFRAAIWLDGKGMSPIIIQITGQGVHAGKSSHSRMILTGCHHAAAYPPVEEAAPGTNDQEVL